MHGIVIKAQHKYFSKEFVCRQVDFGAGSGAIASVSQRFCGCRGGEGQSPGGNGMSGPGQKHRNNIAVFAMNICGYSANTTPDRAVIGGLRLCLAGAHPGFG